MRRLALASCLLLAAPAFGETVDDPASLQRAAQASMAAAMSDVQHGEIDKALDELGTARDLAHRAGDQGDEGVATLYAGVLNGSLHTVTGNETAVELFRAAVPLLGASGNRLGQASAQQGLGDSLAALGRAADALDAYRVALPLLVSPGQEPQRARTLIGLSMVERTLANLADARVHVEAALPLLQQPGDRLSRSTAFMQLGMVCDELSDWACGADAFLSAADVAHALPNPILENQARSRGALDATRDMLGLAKADRAEQAAKQGARAAAAYHQIGDAESEVTALLASGRYSAAAGDWDAAEAAEEAALVAAKDDSGRGRALLALASTANRRGSYRRALGRAEAALPLFAAPELAAQRALVLLIAGNAAAGVHDTVRALGYLAQAQALGAANPGVQAAALAAEGEIRTEQGDPARGATLAREAIALHTRLGTMSAVNKDRGDLGLALAAGGHRAEALATFEASLVAARDAGDVQQEAATLSNIGTVHLAFGDFALAGASFRLAQAAAHRAGDRDAEATAMAQLGMTEHAQGNPDAALASINAAIAIRRESGDSRGEAIDMSDLALVESDMGHSQTALDLYAQVRARFVALADSYHEAVTLNGIGSVYRRLGALDEARRYFRQAVAIHTNDHDEASLSAVLNNLGVIEQSSDELDDALQDYQRALAIQTALGGQVEQITLLNGIAMLRDSEGEGAEALDGLTRALQIAERIGSVEGQALALHNRGAVHERMGEREAALEDLRRALPLWERIGATQNEAATRVIIARIDAAQGHVEDALAEVQGAIGLLESQRGQIASKDLRASLLAGATRAYELRTELLMELDARDPARGFATQALEATEAGRARSLLDLLHEAHTDGLRQVDAGQAGRLQSIRNALSAKALQQAKLGSGGQDGLALAHDIDDLLGEQDRVEAAIRADHPQYAALTAPAPMTAGAIEALLDPQTVLLDFALGDKRSFVWLVTHDAVRAYTLPPRATVLAAVDALRLALAGSSDPRAFDGLGAMLLGPVARAIEGKRLVIIADAPLQAGVPFAALNVPAPSAEQGQAVVQSHEVVMEPSAAVLASIRQATTHRQSPAGAIAVFADPVVSSDDPRLPATAVSADAAPGLEGSLARLPATRREADAILALPHQGAVLSRFGFDATREAAEDDALAGYSIIHFAVHGATDRQSPELSSLVLSTRAPDGTPRDGNLRLADIYGLSLPANLVVLSACGSGLGRAVSGEGLVGLTRGFLYAGAASVVATLWDIQDDATAALMAEFYRAMWGPKAMRPSAALREAQLALVAGGRWSAPPYWAGFAVQGEWR